MAPHWAVWLLAAGLWGLGIGAEVWWNLVPRKTVSSGGECLKLGGAKEQGRGLGGDCLLLQQGCSLDPPVLVARF